MSWTRRIRRNTITAAALGFAVAAVGVPSASAMARDDSVDARSVDAKSLIEQHLANEARDASRAGFVARSGQGGPRFHVGPRVDGAKGVAQPDGYQPQLRGDEALVIRGQPDGYQPQGTDVAVAATGSSMDWGNVALGLGLGIGIAALCALMLIERTRTRVAHS